MPRRRTTDRDPGQRRLPSGKWQVFVRLKGPGDTRARFRSTTFPADSGVTERRACRRVEQRATADGVTLDLSQVRPYDFRHSYATALRAATHDLRTTQRLMLHQSARTTERYARAAVDPVLTAAVDRFTEYVRRDRE